MVESYNFKLIEKKWRDTLHLGDRVGRTKDFSCASFFVDTTTTSLTTYRAFLVGDALLRYRAGQGGTVQRIKESSDGSLFEELLRNLQRKGELTLKERERHYCCSCNSLLQSQDTCLACGGVSVTRRTVEWSLVLSRPLLAGLLKNTDTLTWSKGNRAMQREWIRDQLGHEMVLSLKEYPNPLSLRVPRGTRVSDIAFLGIPLSHPLAQGVAAKDKEVLQRRKEGEKENLALFLFEASQGGEPSILLFLHREEEIYGGVPRLRGVDQTFLQYAIQKEEGRRGAILSFPKCPSPFLRLSTTYDLDPLVLKDEVPPLLGPYRECLPRALDLRYALLPPLIKMLPLLVEDKEEALSLLVCPSNYSVAELFCLRYLTYLLFQEGTVVFREPVPALLTTGTVVYEGVLSQKDMEDHFGLDALRLTLLSSAPVEKNVTLKEETLEASYWFIHRIWSVFQRSLQARVTSSSLDTQLSMLCAKVCDCMESRKFNKVVSVFLPS